jgi:hypothetical protein
MLSRKPDIEFSFPHRLAYRKEWQISKYGYPVSHGYASHSKFKICILVYSSVLGIWLVWVTCRQTANTILVRLKALRNKLHLSHQGCISWVEAEDKKEMMVDLSYVLSWWSKKWDWNTGTVANCLQQFRVSYLLSRRSQGLVWLLATVNPSHALLIGELCPDTCLLPLPGRLLDLQPLDHSFTCIINSSFRTLLEHCLYSNCIILLCTLFSV